MPTEQLKIDAAEQVHETIFLQPWCDGCEKQCYGSDGRQWCEDDVWGKCEECDQKPVKYVCVSAQSCSLNDALKVIRAEPCPFKEGPMADGWAEAWATFLNRLSNVDGTNELFANSAPAQQMPASDEFQVVPGEDVSFAIGQLKTAINDIDISGYNAAKWRIGKAIAVLMPPPKETRTPKPPSRLMATFLGISLAAMSWRPSWAREWTTPSIRSFTPATNYQASTSILWRALSISIG